MQVPVYKGAAVPLLERDYTPYPVVHGEDGLGDVPHIHPEIDEALIQQEHAVTALNRLARQYKGISVYLR